MSEKFCLKWNDFNSNVSKSFGLLRNEEYLHDVTLVSDDNKQVSAHKLVLSACSEYFKNIFRNNHKHQHPLLCLDGLSSTDLTNVLDYIYNGEVQIYQDNLDRFLAVAQKFKLEGLLGGEDQSEEIAYNDTTSNVKEEDCIQNYESYVMPVQLEKERKTKPRDQVQKVDGTISLNTNGNELNDIDEKLMEHVARLPNKTLQCKICGKTASQLSNIKNHIETHVEGLSFPCPVCGKTFRSRHTMRSHKSQNHK